MTTDAGIDYMTPALEHICHIADEMGGAAKPSGAEVVTVLLLGSIITMMPKHIHSSYTY